MEVTLLGPRLLAVATREETFCGGSYPNHGPGGLLYDLRTGARIELEAQMADPRAFRRLVAGRAVAAAPKDAGECAGEHTGERLAGTGFIYILNARSLTAIPDYPHVIQACGFDTAISFADVVRFAKPGSPLRSLGPR
jgi:hypothetical protein